MKKFDRIEIEWIDSCASHGWGSRDFHIKDFSYSNCRSCGYVIDIAPRSITVAQSLSDDTRNMADTISIPRVAIKKIKILK